MTEDDKLDLRTGTKEVGKKVQKVAFQAWLFLQVVGLIQSPMYFIQTAMLIIIAMVGLGFVFGIETALFVMSIGAVAIIVLGYVLHKLGFWTALRNWQYGGQDNDTWFHRSKLACALNGYYYRFATKEEIETTIEEQISWLFDKWSGAK
jgi:hypothetical protein